MTAALQNPRHMTPRQMLLPKHSTSCALATHPPNRPRQQAGLAAVAGATPAGSYASGPEARSMPVFINPSPRARPAGWMVAFERYKEDIEAAKAEGRHFDLVLLGDSITEYFRGTQHGKEDAKFRDNKRAFQELIASRYRAAVYSIGGDMSHNLLWRLRNGGGLEGLDMRMVGVLIGSNDIAQLAGVYNGDPDRDPPHAGPWPSPLSEPQAAAHIVFARVKQVLEEVALQAPAAKLAILSLPPLQPDWLALGGDADARRLQGVADSVNGLLQAYAAERSALYVDCTAPFLEEGSWRVNKKFMPDGIHPLRPKGELRGGGWVLARCVAGALQQVLQEGAG